MLLNGDRRLLVELIAIDNSGEPIAGDGEDFIPRRQHKLLVTTFVLETHFSVISCCIGPPYPAISTRHLKYVTAKGQL